MLSLVISTPTPAKPEDVAGARLKFRTWVQKLKSDNKILHFYPRVGRGSAVIFDIASNDELHGLLTEWLNIVPVQFDIYPLATPSEAEKMLE